MSPVADGRLGCWAEQPRAPFTMSPARCLLLATLPSRCSLSGGQGVPSQTPCWLRNSYAVSTEPASPPPPP